MHSYERYYEIQPELSAFLSAILEGASRPELFKDPAQLQETFECLLKNYPFLDVCYALDKNGIQTGPNFTQTKLKNPQALGHGTDRSHRAYFRQARMADSSVLTKPYLSSATKEICITAAMPVRDVNGELLGVLVADVNFKRALTLLEGDQDRRRLEPFFKGLYGLFSMGLLIISLGLLSHALIPLLSIWNDFGSLQNYTNPFQATILLTLGLAIFDLAKTIFEEEVLLHKDVRRHSATRRTLTRFIAAILIAVSIETLMLVFKFAIDDPARLEVAAWLMLGNVGMLIGLGIYVYLGSKAEIALLQHADSKRKNG